MRTRLFLFIHTLCSLPGLISICSAQSDALQVIDSLRNQQDQCRSVKCDVEVLSEINAAYFDLQAYPDSVISISKRIIAFCNVELINHPKDFELYSRIKVVALRNQGYAIHFSRGEPEAAFKLYNESLTLAKKLNYDEMIASLYGLFAFYYQDAARVDTAILLFEKAKTIYLSLGDSGKVAEQIYCLAGCSDLLHDSDQQIKYLEECKQIGLAIGDSAFLSYVYNDLAQANGDRINCANCEEYLNESIRLSKKYNLPVVTSAALINLGSLLTLRGDNEKAKQVYLEALENSIQIYDAHTEMSALVHLGFLNLEDDPKQSIRYSQAAFRIARKLNVLVYVGDIAETLSLAYEKDERPIQALKYYKIYERIEDSLTTESNKKAAYKAQLNHEFEKKEIMIKAQSEKEIEIAEQDSSQQRTISIFIGFFAIILSVLVLWIYRRYRVTNAQNTLINQQNQDIKLSSNKILQIEREKHELELAQKQRDLEMVNANNLMKLTVRKNLYVDLKHLVRLPNPLIELKSLLAEMLQQTLAEEKIQTIHNNMKAVDSKFLEVLHSKFPELTKTEREICAYIKLNLTIKEIASLRKSTTNSIGVIRSRIRTKLLVPQKENLEAFIQNV